MWTTILGLVIGGLPAVLKSLAQAKVDLANSQTEREKNDAYERVQTLQTRADALAKAEASPWTHVARGLFVAPCALYWAWTAVWDKLLCPTLRGRAIEDLTERKVYTDLVCTTDPLASWQLNVFMLIVTFYFAGQMLDKFKR